MNLVSDPTYKVKYYHLRIDCGMPPKQYRLLLAFLIAYDNSMLRLPWWRHHMCWLQNVEKWCHVGCLPVGSHQLSPQLWTLWTAIKTSISISMIAYRGNSGVGGVWVETAFCLDLRPFHKHMNPCLGSLQPLGVNHYFILLNGPGTELPSLYCLCLCS